MMTQNKSVITAVFGKVSWLSWYHDRSETAEALTQRFCADKSTFAAQARSQLLLDPVLLASACCSP